MPEAGEYASDARSSVAVTENSKGEPSIAVKCYAETTELDAVDAAATKALEIYKRVRADLAVA